MVIITNTPTESEGMCPPEDSYTWELVEIGEFEERESNGFTANDPDVINTQSRFKWRMVDFDYDPDQDDQDWNGLEVFTYVTFYRRLVSEANEPERNKQIFKSPRSVAHQILTALGFDVESEESMDLSTKIGTRIKATPIPKANGWPKLEKFSKTRQKRRVVTEDVEEDDSPTTTPKAASPFKRDSDAA